MTRMHLLAAVAAVMGTTALVGPQLATAQDQTAAPPAVETPAPGPATGPGMGPDAMMGPRGPMFDFAAVDADKDGKITQDELKAWRAGQIAGLDADGNGLISETELSAHIRKLMDDRADEMAKARIAAQDIDGDGALSAAELAMPPLPAKLFDRADADGDGAVSQAEFDAARARMDEQRARMHDRGGPMGRHRHHGPMQQDGGPDQGPDGGPADAPAN